MGLKDQNPQLSVNDIILESLGTLVPSSPPPRLIGLHGHLTFMGFSLLRGKSVQN